MGEHWETGAEGGRENSFGTGRGTGANRWQCEDEINNSNHNPEGANRWQGGNEFRHNNHNPVDNKRFVPDIQKVVMDPETHPEMAVMMKKIAKKFNGVHLNKLLGCQER